MTISEYSKIKKQGGIRVKYSNYFKYFYNLPHSHKTYESKRLVKFQIDDQKKKIKVSLRYKSDKLITKATIIYLDDTAFPNGQTYKNVGYSEMDLLVIKDFFNKLP